jgi:CO dehydrogenase/acetyl-CoA synthase beta subunit
MSFDSYPIGIGPQFEGERIRRKELIFELSGPKAKGFELCLDKNMKEIEENKVVVIGPDLSEM